MTNGQGLCPESEFIERGANSRKRICVRTTRAKRVSPDSEMTNGQGKAPKVSSSSVEQIQDSKFAYGRHEPSELVRLNVVVLHPVLSCRLLNNILAMTLCKTFSIITVTKCKQTCSKKINFSASIYFIYTRGKRKIL